jgi:hypothetical protein
MGGTYKASDGRLIDRGDDGRFRKTTLGDLGIGTCEVCGAFTSPDWEALGPCPDPRRVNEHRRRCPEHRGA